MPVIFPIGEAAQKLVLTILERMRPKDFVTCQSTCKLFRELSKNIRSYNMPIDNYILIYQEKDPHGEAMIRIALHKCIGGPKIREIYEDEAREFFEYAQIFRFSKITLSGSFPSSKKLIEFVERRLNGTKIYCHELEILCTGGFRQILDSFHFKEINLCMNCKLESLLACPKIPEQIKKEQTCLVETAYQHALGDARESTEITIKNVKINPEILFEQIKQMKIVHLVTNSAFDVPFCFQSVINAMKNAKNVRIRELEIRTFSTIGPNYKETPDLVLIQGRNTRPTSIYLSRAESGFMTVAVVENECRDIIQNIALHKDMTDLFHFLVKALSIERQNIAQYERLFIRDMNRSSMDKLERVVERIARFRT